MKQEPPGGPVRRITAEEAQDLTGNIFMNREETAKYLGVSEKTLAGNRGTFASYYKFGGRVLYKLEDVENWARQQKVERRQGWYPFPVHTYVDKLGPYRTLSVGEQVWTLGDMAGLKLGARIATNDGKLLTLVEAVGSRYWVDRKGDTLYSALVSWLPVVILPPVVDEKYRAMAGLEAAVIEAVVEDVSFGGFRGPEAP